MPFSPVYDTLAALPLPSVDKTIFQSWQPGVTPLSTQSQVFSALTAYLAIVLGGQHIMRDYKPFKLKSLFMLHNVLLSLGSGLLLAVMLEELIPIIYREGLLGSICNVAAWTPKLESFYMINNYFKYWELLDTGFLVVKKKPLKFLHVFHHSATALLTFVQLNGKTSVSWVPIVLNLTVHVLMYYYYFATTCGYKIWWKKYLTTMQITQFIIDLCVVYFASYTLFVSRYLPTTLPHCGACAGTETAAIFGCALLTSYLFLFIAFYRATYKSKAAVKPSSSAAAAAAAAAEKAPLLKETSSDDKIMQTAS